MDDRDEVGASTKGGTVAQASAAVGVKETAMKMVVANKPIPLAPPTKAGNSPQFEAEAARLSSPTVTARSKAR